MSDIEYSVITSDVIKSFDCSNVVKGRLHFGCKEEKQQNTRTHKTFNSFKQHSSSWWFIINTGGNQRCCICKQRMLRWACPSLQCCHSQLPLHTDIEYERRWRLRRKQTCSPTAQSRIHVSRTTLRICDNYQHRMCWSNFVVNMEKWLYTKGPICVCLILYVNVDAF